MSLMCCYQQTCIQQHAFPTWTIMQQTIFSLLREKSRKKNLDKLRFYWPNMRKKAGEAGYELRTNNSKKQGKQSFSDDDVC